jgi:hypothetical protein
MIEPGGPNPEVDLERQFAETIHPLLESYCFSCHGKEKHKGKLDLSAYSSVAAVLGDYSRWETVLAKLEANEMPPEEAERRPSAELRRNIIDWIRAVRRREGERNAGDPGSVPARRLSNAEYDNTLRDLTGIDLRPAREFPVDPANQAGFDNSAESLSMSPLLLTKYLEAARHVAEHVVLQPRGFAFAPHPVVTETDRDKYCVKRIVDFYARQPTDYADYFQTAWRFQHRTAFGEPDATLSGLAARDKISPRYLATIWSTLTEKQEALGPIAELQAMWRALPPPGKDDVAVRRGCEQMRDYVTRLRKKLQPNPQNLGVPGIAEGSQPFVLWKDRQLASSRRRCDPDALMRARGEQPEEAAGLTQDAADHFCAVFPDAFYVSERGLIFLKEDNESRGRLLSAGFHLMVGYFRDDAPLYELLLGPDDQRELDALWDELRFITFAPLRQYKDYIFFERAEPPRFMQGAEFDFARSEDREVISEAKIQQLAVAYVAKARRNGGQGLAIQAIEDYFRDISAEIRRVESARLAAEPAHLEALLDFAERAFRRPLTQVERDDLLAFYRALRRDDGLSQEDAIRDAITRVLVSPSFCYRIDRPRESGEEGAAGSGATDRRNGLAASVPLSDYALASRLSYFLWSSMPDRTLLDHAAAGDLHQPEVLVSQARRMLQHPAIRGFVTEFGGNWLGFRRFEEHNSVDRERFPAFTNELRQAMFEEPIRFLLDLVREDRSVLDLLYTGRTFVNPILAKHYGMPEPSGRLDALDASEKWVRVDDARPYGRGGVLPSGSFPDQKRFGIAHQPSPTRKLGHPPTARRICAAPTVESS